MILVEQFECSNKMEAAQKELDDEWPGSIEAS